MKFLMVFGTLCPTHFLLTETPPKVWEIARLDEAFLIQYYPVMNTSQNLPKIARTSFILGGGTIVCLIVVYVSLFISSMVRHPNVHHFVILSYNWETLVAAVFAIAAAVIGVGAVLYQVNQTSVSEKARLTMRERAHRAALPLALSELSDYARKCADVHLLLLTQQKNGIIRASGIQFPALPSGLVAGFTDLMETSDEAHCRPLIDLIRRVQIQHARALNIQERASGQKVGSLLLAASLVSAVFDAAEIVARCGALFKYSREETADPAHPITFENIYEATFSLLISYHDMMPFVDSFKHREELGKEDGTWPLWIGS